MNRKHFNLLFILFFIVTSVSMGGNIYLFILYSARETAFRQDKLTIINNFNGIKELIKEKTQIIDDMQDKIRALNALVGNKTDTIEQLENKVTALEENIAMQDKNVLESKNRLESVEMELKKVLMDIEDTVKNLDNFTDFEHGWRQDYNKALIDLLTRVKEVNLEVEAICDLYNIKFEYVE
jgi:peptidoglycan hydrolase CwlO-like protein